MFVLPANVGISDDNSVFRIDATERRKIEILSKICRTGRTKKFFENIFSFCYFEKRDLFFGVCML